MEVLKEFFNSVEWNSMLTAAIAYVSANLGAWIIFLVKFIGLKKQELKTKAENDQVISAIEAKYGSQIAELEAKLDAKLDEVCNRVVKKIDEDDAAKKAEIDAETIRLSAAIEATKQALNKTNEE